ncbi:chromate reductase [Azomonas agilis]|uniref:Chromate reductase n=1 Tax=Azomonas agilis TaxID=116849 RepID=A0A562IXX7_9GAMM|nr:NAD(P)H-dependent oxidoreductase [Azomonas agilis]TWH75911.1 chromate reductase [Azomonas agilis]
MSQSIPNILGICGSLRKDSNSLAILNTLAESLKDKAHFRIQRLDDVPLYNQDLDTPEVLPGVAVLRAAIGAADGIVIVTPEYNYGLPGVVKNALDWASRPYNQSTLTGKPVLSVSSSPAFTGGVRALAQLNETLLAIGVQVLSGPQVVIGTAHEKIRDGRLVDTATLNFLDASFERLFVEIAQIARR